MNLKKLSLAMLYACGPAALPALAAAGGGVSGTAAEPAVPAAGGGGAGGALSPADSGDTAADAGIAVVVVEGSRAPALRASTAVASRLGLSVLETPASVSVITREAIEGRGARSLDEAVRGAVGIHQGGNPTSPSQTSSRGFTSGFVSHLYDGTRIAVPTMSGRTQDAWNYERIEILKGPASIMYGEGAIGGAINFVTKRPDRAAPATEALLSWGSFATWRAAVGINRRAGETGAVRVDYSHQQGNGHVERNEQRYDHLTMGYTAEPARGLRLDLSLDVLSDDVDAYQGTPLVPAAFAAEPTDGAGDTLGRVLDRRLLAKNYNVDDPVMRANSAWLRAKLAWEMGPAWSLRNELSFYTAKRRWANAESQAFAAPGQLVRDLVGVTHDHQVASDRLDLAHSGSLAGMRNRFAAGVEVSDTDFAAGRRFSNGSAAANCALGVDILAPVLGSYADLSANPDLYAGAGNRTEFGTGIRTWSVFAEDALSLGAGWTLVAGLRRDRVDLDRTILDLGTGARSAYAQRYEPRSARLGVVHALGADTSVYAQATNATAPVGSGNLLLLSAANASFDLSRGKQVEAGIKGALAAGRLQYTLAAYRIALDNILSRDASVPTLTVNDGSQSSRGVELAFDWRIGRGWSASGNAAWLDARFDRLVESGNVSRAGNLPPNVAKRTANFALDHKLAGLPLTLGAGVQHVGARFANNANTLTMDGYTIVDAHAAWALDGSSLTLRVRNLGDRVYATWSGANPNHQVILGAPRSVDLTWRTGF